MQRIAYSLASFVVGLHQVPVTIHCHLGSTKLLQFNAVTEVDGGIHRLGEGFLLKVAILPLLEAALQLYGVSETKWKRMLHTTVVTNAIKGPRIGRSHLSRSAVLAFGQMARRISVQIAGCANGTSSC